MPKQLNILGGVLAGGLSRRMEGQEKSLLRLDGKTLLDIASSRLEPQVDHLVINANGDGQRFGNINIPIVSDNVKNFAGPLAGIHALMEYALNSKTAFTHVASVAADTPFFPKSFVQNCAEYIENEDGARSEYETITIAKSGGFRHPVFGVWPVSLFASLGAFLDSADTRKVMAFVQNHSHGFIEFPMVVQNNSNFDPFFNINTPLDMETACAINSKMNPVVSND